MDVLSVGTWKTNAALIADVAQLGYLDGTVLDATYGEGNFWKEWRPNRLVTNDRYKPADVCADYCDLPFADNSFDSVVFDPPYRMSGRRDRGEFDQRFGLAEYKSTNEILEDIVAGATECFRVASSFLLVKCQDQVSSGRKQWQTDLLTLAIQDAGGRKVDRFDFLNPAQRPQPAHRPQRTSRSNSSQLLVFGKGLTLNGVLRRSHLARGQVWKRGQ